MTSHRTRTGNWQEDRALSEFNMRSFAAKREAGQLLSLQHKKKLEHTLRGTKLASRDEGAAVCFGDHVLLFCGATKGILSTDLDDVIQSDRRCLAVTTSTLFKGAVVRNTFVIEPAGRPDATDVPSGPLLYDQPFRLRCHSDLISRPHYLSSTRMTPGCSAKFSRHQEVVLCPAANYGTVWKALHKDASIRLETEGLPVPANAVVVIQHAQTHECLSSDSVQYENDYGCEFEVTAHTHQRTSKTHVLSAEFNGTSTCESGGRSELAQNHWSFLTTSGDRDAEDDPAG